MRNTILLVFLLLAVISSQPASAGDVERTEEITRTLRFGDTDGARRLIVDNLFGSIEVKGYDGDEVRLIVHKTIIARSDKKLAEAEEEVTLEIYEEDDIIELYVDGPFREKRSRNFNWRGHKREGYKVIYEFEIEVPEDCDVELSTVDDGDVIVESVDGDFDVHNVNGGIQMKGVGGAGEVYAVNGKVRIEFDKNPAGDCLFGTINGDVRIYFQPELSADFYMKTMNGDVFTDFEVISIPGRVKTSNTRNGKSVYKVSRMSGVRAGKGGPSIELNTLNGDMFILSR
jgi:hypothetical protein